MSSEFRPLVHNLEQKASGRHVTYVFGDGTRVTCREITPTVITPSEVSLHEAAHVVASNGEIEKASIVPNGNTLGYVKPKRLTPEGAMAAVGMGYSGGGWDTFITRYILRTHPNRAAARGREKVLAKKEEHFQVAVMLEERRNIYQNDVNEAYTRARKARLGIRPVEIEIIMPEGQKRVHVTESRNWQINLMNFF